MRTITATIIISTVMAWIGWDIYAAFNREAGDTISEVVLAAAQGKPIVPFAVGMIIGHLFWPQSKDD